MAAFGPVMVPTAVVVVAAAVVAGVEAGRAGVGAGRAGVEVVGRGAGEMPEGGAGKGVRWRRTGGWFERESTGPLTSCGAAQGALRSVAAPSGSRPPAAVPTVRLAAGVNLVAAPARLPAARAGRTPAGPAGGAGDSCRVGAAGGKLRPPAPGGRRSTEMWVVLV